MGKNDWDRIPVIGNICSLFPRIPPKFLTLLRRKKLGRLAEDSHKRWIKRIGGYSDNSDSFATHIQSAETRSIHRIRPLIMCNSGSHNVRKKRKPPIFQ